MQSFLPQLVAPKMTIYGPVFRALLLFIKKLVAPDFIVAYLRYARTVTSKHAPAITQQ
jgi:hypothetical protein